MMMKFSIDVAMSCSVPRTCVAFPHARCSNALASFRAFVLADRRRASLVELEFECDGVLARIGDFEHERGRRARREARSDRARIADVVARRKRRIAMRVSSRSESVISTIGNAARNRRRCARVAEMISAPGTEGCGRISRERSSSAPASRRGGSCSRASRMPDRAMRASRASSSQSARSAHAICPPSIEQQQRAARDPRAVARACARAPPRE